MALHIGTAHPHQLKDGTVIYNGTNMMYHKAYNFVAIPPQLDPSKCELKEHNCYYILLFVYSNYVFVSLVVVIVVAVVLLLFFFFFFFFYLLLPLLLFFSLFLPESLELSVSLYSINEIEEPVLNT